MVKLVLSFLVSVMFWVPCVAQSTLDKSKVEADRLWEQVVKARGGREKLQSVSNMLVTTGDNAEDIRIQFYAFPRKYWEWNKDKKFHDFMFVTMTNLDYGVHLSASYEGTVASEKLTPVTGGGDYRDGWLIEACAFLLETKWARPSPVRIRTERIGKERLDVIETVFDQFPPPYRNWGLDYYVDPESLEIKHVAWTTGGQRPFHVYHFGRGTVVDGIMVPCMFGVSMGSEKKDQWSNTAMRPMSFKFNVDYNPQLFEVPPSVAAGPDAWKKKAYATPRR